MKISWRYRVTILVLVGVFGAILVTWMLNRFFLQDFYLHSKMDTLDTAYQQIRKILETKEDTSEEDGSLTNEELQQKAEKFLTDDEKISMEILSTQNNLDISFLWNSFYSTTSGSEKLPTFIERIRSYLYPGSSFTYRNVRKLKMVEDEYEIFYIYDERTQSNYVELFSGNPETGNFILLRTNIESIQESVEIANRFLTYAGFAVALLTAVVVLLATKSVVRPIRELSLIAKRMSDLDFDTKYEGKTSDEIGELGQSINALSKKLEQTISDLKSANNQLQTDIEQKVQIDEMRKEFLSNVTHELKTPIALIQGYAEGLKDNINEDAESRDFYCDVIIDESMKMNKMVKKLLTLNQIEFGNQMVEMERFDLSELIRSVVQSSEILMQQKEIRLLYQPVPGLEVWADESMIEEVVTNYLTNAINHADFEKIIEIKTLRQDTTVRVTVFNSGQPIPEEELDKIWIKFYKVDKARTREYGGSGIGLSIVKAIMEAHNKPFGVINHSNGVEFWFELDAKVE